jgi:hypothetical protein
MSTDVSQSQLHFQNPLTQHAPSHGDPTKIQYPGLTGEMKVKPDHGEETYKGLGRLKDRRAVITGGDSGIGRAVAIAYAREGADVMISCYEDEREDAEETKKWVEDAGRKCVIELGDIRSEEKCKCLVDKAIKELGGIDILVNNAAFQMVHDKIEELPSEDFDRTMKTNIYVPFWLCKAAVPHMPSGSAIINTSSVQGFKENGRMIDYNMTKGALLNLTKSLGCQLVGRGIRVNSVAPGPIWTPLIPSTMPEPMVAKFGQESPMERPGQPVEVAPAYVFLASQESSYITSEILAVTGGMTITG